jgi:hypothetical protein
MKPKAVCIIPNCGKSAPPHEPFCAKHRRDGDDVIFTPAHKARAISLMLLPEERS